MAKKTTKTASENVSTQTHIGSETDAAAMPVISSAPTPAATKPAAVTVPTVPHEPVGSVDPAAAPKRKRTSSTKSASAAKKRTEADVTERSAVEPAVEPADDSRAVRDSVAPVPVDLEPSVVDAPVPVVAGNLPLDPTRAAERPTTSGAMPDERRDNIRYGDSYYDGMSGGYAEVHDNVMHSEYVQSVGAEPVRASNKLLWIVIAVMTALCIAVGVLSSTLTGYFMRSGAQPPIINPDNLTQAVAAVVASRTPNIVEINCNGLRGSGVITKLENNKIYIITNSHVLSGSSTAAVRFYGDDSFYSAETVGYSSYYDIAVVTVEGYIPPYVVYDLEGTDNFSADVKYANGDYTVAIGNAMSMGIAAYDGIVSRSADLLRYDDKTVPVLRTTAAINAGMSGGGLFDMAGRLIGIGTYRMTSLEGGTTHADDVEDTGFAVPMSIVYPVYMQILETAQGGEESHLPSLAFSKPATTSVGSITFNLHGFGVFTAEYRSGRLTVTNIDANMPPTAIEIGDEITAVGAVDVTSDICGTCGEFLHYRYGSLKGSVMELSVRRGDDKFTVTVNGYYRYVA